MKAVLHFESGACRQVLTPGPLQREHKLHAKSAVTSVSKNRTRSSEGKHGTSLFLFPLKTRSAAMISQVGLEVKAAQTQL